MLNTINYSLTDDLGKAVAAEIQGWNADDMVSRIWAKDASVWSGSDEAKWLAWLDIADEQLADVGKYADFHADIMSAGFTDVALLGMGGSSLCPEVLALTFGRSNFHILDSTVPAQVKTLQDKLDLEKTLFIVASKSGSTLEPNCFKQYFFDLLAEKVGPEQAGRNFIAITDPGSKMEQVAKDDKFRHIFYGRSEIGGRFSALSAFGMTAAASMGLNVEKFLHTSNEMVTACKSADAGGNPGALLGMILGVCQREGRDKLTIFASPEIHDLGAWLEQLIAESTGKLGIAIIPVDREPAQDPAQYSDDRVFAFLQLKGNGDFDAFYGAVAAAGHPAVKMELDGIDNLGQEFFRWEFATAVAGSIMEINPFNQPDVEAAKIEARKITDEYEQTGSLPEETPFYESDGVSLFSSDEYGSLLLGSAADRSLKGLMDAHVAQIVEDDYFALLGYVEMNERNEKLLTKLRKSVLKRAGVATCLGFGPRFLHSTGQAYKGGGNNSVVLQITSDDAFDLAVPGQKYTFGVVKAAQARGDFQVLLERGRRALRVHLGSDVDNDLARLVDLF